MSEKTTEIFQLEIKSNGSANLLSDPTRPSDLAKGGSAGAKSSFRIDDGSVSLTLTLPITDAIRNSIEELKAGRYTIAVVFDDPDDCSTAKSLESNIQSSAVRSSAQSGAKVGIACYPDGGGGHFCIP